MSMNVMDKELKNLIKQARVHDKELNKLIKQIGYKGCRNCRHQTALSRMCGWGEQGGDGHIHFICPRWNKKESEDKYDR